MVFGKSEYDKQFEKSISVLAKNDQVQQQLNKRFSEWDQYLYQEVKKLNSDIQNLVASLNKLTKAHNSLVTVDKQVDQRLDSIEARLKLLEDHIKAASSVEEAPIQEAET